jgi:hypothetical protein
MPTRTPKGARRADGPIGARSPVPPRTCYPSSSGLSASAMRAAVRRSKSRRRVQDSIVGSGTTVQKDARLNF